MPIITVKDPATGKIVKFDWKSDTKPTDDELTEIFNSPRVTEWKKGKPKGSDKSEGKDGKKEDRTGPQTDYSGQLDRIASIMEELVLSMKAGGKDDNSAALAEVAVSISKLAEKKPVLTPQIDYTPELDRISDSMRSFAEAVKPQNNSQLLGTIQHLLKKQQEVITQLTNHGQSASRWDFKVTKRDRTGNIEMVSAEAGKCK